MAQLWTWPLLALAAARFALAVVMPPCDTTRTPNEVCEDFCNDRCGFYNVSVGDTGSPGKLTLFRLTPTNVTGLRNKDTGDAPGDIGYWLMKKNITRQCAQDPKSFGCIDDGDNLYGVFDVEVDGQFGPYLQCNQLRHGPNPFAPIWEDTSRFICGMNCLVPTTTGCHSYDQQPDKNGSSYDGSFHCHCDSTARDTRTVGRSEPPFLAGKSSVPDSWVPQCKQGYVPAPAGVCPQGAVHATVHGWSFESTLAMACEACSQDQNCTGWATQDNRTARLFRGKVLPVRTAKPCLGAWALAWTKGTSWFGVGDLGGYWYSTPAAGECAPGAPLGADGCTWREVASTYKNASCVDGKVDAAVEVYGRSCFNRCSLPLNRTSDCYLDCYHSVIQGDAARNITKMPDAHVIEPWVRATREEDPKKGGCPAVTPKHCKGEQCDPLLPGRHDVALVV